MSTPRHGRQSEQMARTRPVARSSNTADAGGGKPLRLGVWVLVFLVLVIAVVIIVLWGLYALRGQWASAGPTPTYIIWTPSPAPMPVANPTPTAVSAPSGAEEMPTVSAMARAVAG